MIETLAALTLLAMLAASMGNFLAAHIRHSSSNALYSIGYALAAQELERARAQDYKTLTGETMLHLEGGVMFAVFTEVANDTPRPNTKTVTATVSWNEPNGLRQISLPVVYTEIRNI